MPDQCGGHQAFGSRTYVGGPVMSACVYAAVQSVCKISASATIACTANKILHAVMLEGTVPISWKIAQSPVAVFI